jgi:hypothetical protein
MSVQNTRRKKLKASLVDQNLTVGAKESSNKVNPRDSLTVAKARAGKSDSISVMYMSLTDGCINGSGRECPIFFFGHAPVGLFASGAL